MNMHKIYMKKAKELIKEGYTSDDIEKIAEEEFLPEEVEDELYECMVELEGDENDA